MKTLVIFLAICVFGLVSADGKKCTDIFKTTARPYEFRAVYAGNSNSAVTVPISTVNCTSCLNTGGVFDETTHRFNVPVTGTYSIKVTLKSNSVRDGGVGVQVFNYPADTSWRKIGMTYIAVWSSKAHSVTLKSNSVADGGVGVQVYNYPADTSWRKIGMTYIAVWSSKGHSITTERLEKGSMLGLEWKYGRKVDEVSLSAYLSSC